MVLDSMMTTKLINDLLAINTRYLTGKNDKGNTVNLYSNYTSFANFMKFISDKTNTYFIFITYELLQIIICGDTFSNSLKSPSFLKKISRSSKNTISSIRQK